MIPRLSISKFALVMAAATTTACAGLPRPRNYSDADWVAAAREFDASPSRRSDEKSLYFATFLFGTPGRPTYDPTRARGLLLEFSERFPDSKRREEVADRLALLDDIVHTQRDASARQHEVETQLATATGEVRLLRERLDSASAQGEQARRSVAKLEADLKDREDQVKALRLELQRLKAIDLKPRKP